LFNKSQKKLSSCKNQVLLHQHRCEEREVNNDEPQNIKLLYNKRARKLEVKSFPLWPKNTAISPAESQNIPIADSVKIKKPLFLQKVTKQTLP